jgi:hypothetical protein
VPPRKAALFEDPENAVELMVTETEELPTKSAVVLVLTLATELPTWMLLAVRLTFDVAVRTVRLSKSRNVLVVPVPTETVPLPVTLLALLAVIKATLEASVEFSW